MTVESATYLSQLDSTLPTGGDVKSEGDNHLRLLKSVLKATFPNIDSAVSPTPTKLNLLTSAAASSWTPTMTPVANCTANVVTAGQYIRIGNIVIASVELIVNATAGGAYSFTLSPPVGTIVTCAGTSTHGTLVGTKYPGFVSDFASAQIRVVNTNNPATAMDYVYVILVATVS